MSRKNKIAEAGKQFDYTNEKKPTASVRSLPTGRGPVPVAPALKNVQLTPIVQPITFIPYSSQEQPLFTYDDDVQAEDIENEMVTRYKHFNQQKVVDESVQGVEVVYASNPTTKKGIKLVPLVTLLFSVLIIGVLVAGNYFLKEILALSQVGAVNLSGYGYVETLIELIKAKNFEIKGLLIPSSIVLIAFFSVINVLNSLFRITKRNAGVFGLISSFVVAVCVAIMLTTIFTTTGIEIAIGSWIVAGLAFINFVLAFSVKANKKV